MKEKWFHRDFQELHKEGYTPRLTALHKACSFLNQHNLPPLKFKITEGWTLKPPSDNQYDGFYGVTILYLSEKELPFEDIQE